MSESSKRVVLLSASPKVDQSLAVSEILAKRGRRPIIIKATTDVLGAIIKGERLHITNVAASGVAHRLGVRSTTLATVHFRVVGYEHSWDRGSWPVTTITARSIDS